MKNIPFDAYQEIYEALIATGHDEEEAEFLIAKVIEDQIDFTNYAERIHRILQKIKIIH